MPGATHNGCYASCHLSLSASLLIGIIIIPIVQRFLILTQFPIALPNPGPYGTLCPGQGPGTLSLFSVHIPQLLALTETWMFPENAVSCSPLVEAHVPPLLSFAASESFLLHSPSKNPTSLKIMSLSYTTHPSSLQSSTNPLLTPSHSLKLSTLGSFSFSSLLLSLFLVTSVTRWIILCYLILLFCNDPFLLSTLINQTFI